MYLSLLTRCVTDWRPLQGTYDRRAKSRTARSPIRGVLTYSLGNDSLIAL